MNALLKEDVSFAVQIYLLMFCMEFLLIFDASAFDLKAYYLYEK